MDIGIGGMEDDDIFISSQTKGLKKETFMNHEDSKKINFVRFNGLNDYIKIVPNDSIRELTSESFTWSVMVRGQIRHSKVFNW